MKKETVEILKDKNRIFDIKNDIAFKTVFLSKEGKGLLCEILSELLKIDYYYVYENIEIINGNVPSLDIKRVKSQTDIICLVENNQFIVEMNNRYYEKSIYKNGYYLFSNYVEKANNQNEYGKNLNTYLINIDNFDVIKKNEFIYTFSISEDKYKNILYKNIKIININLDYLRKIEYTKYNKLEKLFKIFVETDISKLKDLMGNRNIERVIRFMDKLKNHKDYMIEYDYEAFKATEYEDALKENTERNRREYEEKLEEKLEEQVIKMKQNNISNEIISNITGLSLEEIANIN